MAKLLLIFFLLLFISVAIADSNQSITIDGGGKIVEENILLRTTLLSLMLVVISLIQGHYMDDHDEYNKRLINFQHYYFFRNEPKNAKSENGELEDCITFRNTKMHFGAISFTLMLCFIISTFIATCLVIEFKSFCEMTLENFNFYIILIIIVVDILLLFQFWMYLRQGNDTALWLKNLENINFEKNNCKKYYVNDKYCHIHKPSHTIGELLTQLRLKLIYKPQRYLNVKTDILFILYFFCLLRFCIITQPS